MNKTFSNFFPSGAPETKFSKNAIHVVYAKYQNQFYRNYLEESYQNAYECEEIV